MQDNAMNQSSEEIQAAAERRSFLLKLLAGGAVVPVVPAVAEAQFGGKGQAGKGQGQGRPGGGMDPAQIAAMLIQQHDKDGDGALNQAELAAALNAMRQRRAQMMQGQQGGGRLGQRQGRPGQGQGRGGRAGAAGQKPQGGIGQGRQGKAGAGKGRGQQGGVQVEGGVRPKRPGN